ncbi:response regulator [Oscillatoria sp. FACHB-1407]|uniref:response regulator n=1 Tax=Oscillatoria sp. FACHB-1407 TaxID=2692847 RepID=UPI001684B00B|nr:response regulator [Oscillatoria sp. FACHB-1407]MBD2464925.1 response regulator [Oscillatoria sp. FACHB-1407]
MKILLIEDDDAFIKVLTRMLKAQQYIVDSVKDGEMGWTYGSTFEYDLMLMDVVLPKVDGISLCKRFRTEGYATPIMLLTAQDTNTAKVQGLDAGADDYVVKTCDQTELTARIRALLRRGSNNPFPLLTWGDLILNPSTCEVTYKGQPLALTTKEYELLELMLRDSQHVFSTEEILDHLWSSEAFPSEATVRSHIRRVRNKLVAVGAPHDFIATMHGRGYYLKAIQPDASASSPAATEPSSRSPHPDSNWASSSQLGTDSSATEDTAPLVDPYSADAQQQYVAFLNDVWSTTKPTSLEQVKALFEAIQALHADRLAPHHQAQAQQLAHKLAGTLSIFGLHKAVHLARQLEHWLGSQDALHPNQAPLMHHLMVELQQVIQSATQIQLSQVPQGHSPLLLLVSAEDAFNQAMGAIASSRGIQVEIVSPLELDSTLTALEMAIDVAGQPPDLLLLRLPDHLTKPSEIGEVSQPHPFLQYVQPCTQRYPTVPIVVMGDRLRTGDRLEVARRGGKLFLDHSTSPEQAMTAAVNLMRRSKLAPKVMIVDDDQHWLRTLPTLLKPWGFKVTTLADPQQFWTVLQAVVPDVLVLDVNLPEINGFELCQMIRNDPHWQRLPVLFLSVLTDSTHQQQAFAAGADDYLCKPLMGGELANRILSRLQRVKAWAG